MAKELQAVPLLYKQKPQQLLRLIQRSISIRQADVEIFVLALLGYKFEAAVLAHILPVLALLGGRFELIVLALILHVLDIVAFRVHGCQFATSTLIG